MDIGFMGDVARPLKSGGRLIVGSTMVPCPSARAAQAPPIGTISPTVGSTDASVSDVGVGGSLAPSSEERPFCRSLYVDIKSLLSAPNLELNRVEVVTLRLRGSTAPTATSGVSTTARILGGDIKADLTLSGEIGDVELIVSLDAAETRGEMGGRVDVLRLSDFRETAGDADAGVDVPGIDVRRFVLFVRGASVSSISMVGLAGEEWLASGHSKWIITFFVAHVICLPRAANH